MQPVIRALHLDASVHPLRPMQPMPVRLAQPTASDSFAGQWLRWNSPAVALSLLALAARKPSLADIKARAMATRRKNIGRKERRERRRAEGKSDWPVEAPSFGRSTGRVVGGAERHGQVLVKVEDREATICQILKGRRAPNLEPVVGDRVQILWTSAAADAVAVVEEVLPRKTSLIKHASVSPKPQLLCANLDLAVVVVSVEPNFSEGMVDRVLVSAHAQGLDAALVLNKVDLLDGAERRKVEQRLFVYERIGYRVVFVSALNGDGLEDLKQLLAHRTSILLGNSGVGKSHLLNELGEGQISAAVGSISAKLKLGKHVTTTTTLHRLPGMEEAYLIDSPGARRFGLWDVQPEELKDHFVEFLPLARECKFADCRHLEEPSCAVKEAVEEGRISRKRYLSYRRIHGLLQEGLEGTRVSSSSGPQPGVCNLDMSAGQDYRRAMEIIMTDETKEHWSELLDVPSDFTGEGGEDFQLYRPKWEEDREESTVNTRTARRILKAGGCRVSRGGTEAQAAAAAVAAAAAAAAKASSMSSRRTGKEKPEEASQETEGTDAWQVDASRWLW
ncbi:unnamed protein product [Effrenium voratum]|nr:unnamed protein product [Effrenium voratum]